MYVWYVCMVCMYGMYGMYVCMYVCTFVCLFVCLSVCSMYICMYISCMYIDIMCVCTYVAYMYVYKFICMYPCWNGNITGLINENILIKQKISYLFPVPTTVIFYIFVLDFCFHLWHLPTTSCWWKVFLKPFCW